MGKTVISIEGENFLINSEKVYSDIESSNPECHGLLFNARFIQGIFDDAKDASKYSRFGVKKWNADENTDALIRSLPQWYAYGLRAFTVGFQGGGPCFTVDSRTINNNPFGTDGSEINDDYKNRMHRLITAADKIGMVVIVSFLYGHQARRLENGLAVRKAVINASRFLKQNAYTNVLIEVANEMDVPEFDVHKIVQEPEGMASLIDLARVESGGMLVSCSGKGGSLEKEVADASDFILIHGNELSRQRYYSLIKQAKKIGNGKPIICNEDSSSIGQLKVSQNTHTSWGYYNNMTKQEPPADWSITKGEDLFFATRMAMCIGLPCEDIPEEDQYYLQGLHENQIIDNEGWIRLASLYPEKIDYVEFYRNGDLYDCCYDEPFSVNYINTWLYGSAPIKVNDTWKAVVYLTSGKKIECTEKYVGESDEC